MSLVVNARPKYLVLIKRFTVFLLNSRPSDSSEAKNTGTTFLARASSGVPY